MPAPLRDIDVLQEYLRGVMEKADHHAQNVDQIALALIGAVVWRKDAADIEVMEHNGKLANVLWVRIGQRRYAMSYNHVAGTIEVREKSTHGSVLASFDNQSPIAQVRTFFESL